MQEEIMLSIVVPTYNHENYIVQALDTILMQETQYSYEVLVGEDCSTDNTRKVLKEYEKLHPGKFKIFYRKENMRNSKCGNGVDLRNRTKGKYLIILEGDDFWIDKHKIEKQILFLESNPEYIAVSHNCVVVDKEGQPNGEVYPECKDNEYTIMHYVNEILPGQLATVMMRNFHKYDYFDKSILEKRLTPGDRLIYFALLSAGKIWCIQEKMTAYRHVTVGGSSFSANYKYDFNKTENWHKELLMYARKIRDKRFAECAEVLYLGALISGLLKWRKITFSEFYQYSKNLMCFSKAFLTYLKRYVFLHYSDESPIKNFR